MGRFAILFALVATLLPATALAQVSLTGTYVSYLAIGTDGTMIDSTTSHSMAYTEAGTTPSTCDLYFPGTPQEGFTVQATGAGGTMLQATNTNEGTLFSTPDAFTTT